MKTYKQKFYETAYPRGHVLGAMKSWLGFAYKLFRRFEVYRNDIVFSLLPVNKKSFVDIGCGEGVLVFKALEKFEKVYGTDIAGSRLKEAENKKLSLNNKLQKRIKFMFVDADEHLPFKRNSIDAVSMVATLEHFYDPFHVMLEVYRILKKGGKVIIEVPNLGFFPRRIDVMLGKLPVTSEHEYGWDGGHLHYFTVSSLKKLLVKQGFDVEVTTCSGVFANLRHFWTSLLGGDIIIVGKKK